MKQLFIGLTIGVLCVLLYNQYTKPVEESPIQGSQIIQEQLKNVSKLVISEGYFSDIITYKDAKKYYLDLLSAEKKAVVLVKAKATIAYDLKLLNFEVNEAQKTIIVSNIPEPELQINTTLNYYDIQQDYLNPFNAKDYNKISVMVNERLEKQIAASTFKSNAENRLLTELHILFSNTTLNGWAIVSGESVQESIIIDK